MKKVEKRIFVGLAVLLLACFIITPVAARPYSWDGYPLETIQRGLVRGDVYVSSGDNAGLQTTAHVPNTLITNFNLPEGCMIEWAKLDVGVSGGRETYRGWAHVTLNGVTLTDPDPEALDFLAPGPHATCVGDGVWNLEFYDIKDVLEGELGNVVTCRVDTWQNDAEFDGRIYGATLIVVYRNSSMNKTAYWINEGLENLNYWTPHNDNWTFFYEPLYKAYDEAKVTLGYYEGNITQNDYAYFNAPNEPGSPYIDNNLNWIINNYRDYQLDNADVADENGGTTHYYDLKSFKTANSGKPLKDVLNLVGNNNVVFKRTHTNDVLSEYYLSPFLAVLTLKDIWIVYDYSNETPGVAGECLKAYYNSTPNMPPLTIDEIDIEFSPADYPKIAYDDGVYKCNFGAMGEHAAQRFEFCCINQTLQDINVTWNGYGNDSVPGATMYLWNWCLGGYEQVDSDSSTPNEITLNYITNSTACYLVNGCINVVVEQNGITTENTTSTLCTDYVRLEVVPHVPGCNESSKSPLTNIQDIQTCSRCKG